MADHQEDLDANEPATAYKLDKARERGSIVRSNEVTFAAVLLGCLVCVYGLVESLMNAMGAMLGHALALVARDGLTRSSATGIVAPFAMQGLLAVAPCVFVIWVSALAAAALQARGVFSTEPLKPDFSRLNPGSAIKRAFSMRALQELARSVIKIGLSAGAMVVWARHRSGDILSIANRSPRGMLRAGIDLAGSALAVLAALALLFALLDWCFNHWDFMRKMRMSKREMKDEHKERDGDPRIKARLRELRLEWLRRTRQLTQVRNADVLLTNPTHYAVALEYRHGEMPAPMITARGAGELAQRMRVEARRRGVPIVEHVPLARALFATKDSQRFVPPEHFDAVARILRWVYAARGPGHSMGMKA